MTFSAQAIFTSTFLPYYDIGRESPRCVRRGPISGARTGLRQGLGDDDVCYWATSCPCHQYFCEGFLEVTTQSFYMIAPLLATVEFGVADFADPLVVSAYGDATSLAATITYQSSIFSMQFIQHVLVVVVNLNLLIAVKASNFSLQFLILFFHYRFFMFGIGSFGKQKMP